MSDETRLVGPVHRAIVAVDVENHGGGTILNGSRFARPRIDGLGQYVAGEVSTAARTS